MYTLPSLLSLYDLKTKTSRFQLAFDDKSPQHIHESYLLSVQYLINQIHKLKEKCIIFVNNCGWV